MTEYTKQLSHLTKLALTPGWKEYTWERLKELDRAPGFEGIKEAVIAQAGHGRLLDSQRRSG